MRVHKRPASWIGIVLAMLLVGVSQGAQAQQLRFRAYNSEGQRPNPPTEFHVDGENVPEYHSVLEGLGSPQESVRQAAALRLYEQRRDHFYHIHDLVPFLDSGDSRVAEFISSVLLDLVVSKPYESGNLRAYMEQFRQLYWKSTHPYIKANCVGLLAMGAVEFSQIEAVVLDAVANGGWQVTQNAVLAAQLFAPPSVDLYMTLSVRLGSKETTPRLDIANAMSSIAASVRGMSESYYADRLLDGAKRLKELKSFDSQVSYIEETASRIRKNSTLLAGFSAAHVLEDEFSIDSSLDVSIFETPGLQINGESAVGLSVQPSRVAVQFLGERRQLKEGFNTLKSAGIASYAWLEDRVLRRFDAPYKRSYAIIAAIDEYGERSPKGSGRSTYRVLGNMVENAKALAAMLERKGFPRENIFLLSDGEATSRKINDLLAEFWSGGRYEKADRLLFYFAGHGDHIQPRLGEEGASGPVGYLITADYDAKRPTASSLLMKDLTGRHFDNIVSHHVLMLIDSCSSGLALPRFQNTESDKESLARFRRYVTIRDEMKRPARNILVAGTGRQEALWQNGGIFTRSIITGLGGGADFNNDRVIEFDELALFTKDAVRSKAAATGVEQEPAAFKASAYGKGSILMLDQ